MVYAIEELKGTLNVTRAHHRLVETGNVIVLNTPLIFTNDTTISLSKKHVMRLMIIRHHDFNYK